MSSKYVVKMLVKGLVRGQKIGDYIRGNPPMDLKEMLRYDNASIVDGTFDYKKVVVDNDRVTYMWSCVVQTEYRHGSSKQFSIERWHTFDIETGYEIRIAKEAINA